MRKLIALLSALLLLCTCAAADSALNAAGYDTVPVRSYTSESLSFTIERFTCCGARCYLTTIHMQDPGQQITKGTAHWRSDLMIPTEIAKHMQKRAMLIINGSGYVSPQFPEIPDNYPGTSKDYWYSPLGSVTVTNGEVLRCLDGVPFYGLTLQADGLHMHVGDDPKDVLAQDPIETWSFYEQCPLIQDHEIIFDMEWYWGQRRAERNIIFYVGDNTYIDMMVTTKEGPGARLTECVEFIKKIWDPEWAYNLDGGPSTCLASRKKSANKLSVVYGNRVKDFDIMGFCELEKQK